ncbi:UNVERIFIED_CONTAM: Beta-catenin-like protein 1 [Sesamum radiatum]|uniref:Beta-catenin-like protein 1 n=1 Tax=Sesamum radiatum TaxID=300843 RepID=A0AAW2V1L4_SESRA
MDLPAPQKRKRSPSSSPPPPPPSLQPSSAPIDLSLLEALEKSQQNAVETLDLKTLKKLALSLERRLNANTAARLKYPDNPDKFAESELELHDELQKLKILAGAPELYPDLVSLGTVNSITGLLNHDNTDIAIDAVTLLQDLTDADVIEDNDEPAQVLVDALIENNAVELLVQNLARLNDSDPDESAAIYNTLSTIENLIEVKPSVSELVCEKTKLLKWLQARIKIREFDSNKQYASEILAILLQNSIANQKRFGRMELTRCCRPWLCISLKILRRGTRRRWWRICLTVCCLLMPLENKERFVKAEGVELMIIIMNQKKLCYGSAIRALDFAMTNYPPACERFIDVMGLKTAFPAFMDTFEQEEQEKRYKEELEERLISLIASLFGGILRGSRRERLLSKFVENECEKIDRIMELYVRYSDRVKAETERLNQLELDDLEIDEEEKYNRKLDSGLYTLQAFPSPPFLLDMFLSNLTFYSFLMLNHSIFLQLIAVILGHLWTSEHSRMRARIELLLKLHKLTKKDVKDILQEYHDNIGDLDGPEEKERAQSKILKFISAFT